MGIMTDERFDEFLREQLRSYREPAEVPRDAMWDAVAEQRRHRRVHRRPTWRYWGIGIAAALVIGVGIGRLSVPNGADTVAVGPTADETADVPVAFRLTTAEHLQQVEIFLTGFRTDARAGRSSVAGGGARNLLATTRVLLDSPVQGDPALQTLLEDIELVLAQIASYEGRPRSDELDLIEESMEQRSVLFRLHSTVDVQPAGMPIQGVL
jgi:hypothetical protein